MEGPRRFPPRSSSRDGLVQSAGARSQNQSRDKVAYAIFVSTYVAAPTHTTHPSIIDLPRDMCDKHMPASYLRCRTSHTHPSSTCPGVTGLCERRRSTSPATGSLKVHLVSQSVRQCWGSTLPCDIKRHVCHLFTLPHPITHASHASHPSIDRLASGKLCTERGIHRIYVNELRRRFCFGPSKAT